MGTFAIRASSSGKRLLFRIGNTCEIHDLQEDGSLSLYQILTVSDTVFNCEISTDEQIVVILYKYGNKRIYKKGANYQQLQNIVVSNVFLDSISISRDGSFIATGDSLGNGFIYKYDGTIYNHFQTIPLGFDINAILIS